MKKTIMILFAIAFIMLLPEFATEMFAPPVIPHGAPTGSPIGAPAGVPIDGGLGFLLAAGVAYGGKKLKERKQSNKSLKENDL